MGYITANAIMTEQMKLIRGIIIIVELLTTQAKMMMAIGRAT